MNHDQLFKELLRTFFVEFIELFLPEVAAYLDPAGVEFLDKEVFTDVAAGERHVVDLLVKARFRGGLSAFFLIHVENQASAHEGFPRRIFAYFARLHEAHDLPVYPIALFSYDAPRRPEPERYQVEFPDRLVLDFNFRVVQLNRLNCRDFVRRPNPIAAALMAKMGVTPEDRPRVKLECLRILATLRLDPARQTLVRRFALAYLQLSEEEMGAYHRELEALEAPEREAVMEAIDEWDEIGIRKGEATIVLRQFRRRFGDLSAEVEARVRKLPMAKLEALGEDMLDFATLADAEAWLARAG